MQLALRCASFCAGPTKTNDATQSEGPFAVPSKLRMPTCCCYMCLFSRHKHAESHITVSFSPGKREDIFSSCQDRTRCTNERDGGSRSGVALLTMAVAAGTQAV